MRLNGKLNNLYSYKGMIDFRGSLFILHMEIFQPRKYDKVFGELIDLSKVRR